MSVTPVSRAVDLKPLRDAIYLALAANSTIAALIGTNIFWIADVTNSSTSYIALTLLIYRPENLYASTTGCAFVQVSCVSDGSPDDARVLRAAASTALLDTRWPVVGWDVLDVQLGAGLPDGTPLDQNKIVWVERDRYEVTIRKQTS